MNSELEQICTKLYRDHKEDLYAYLIRSLRDEATARDLLQDVYLHFYRFFQDKELPPSDTERRMYLFRIARNLMINNSRSAYVRRVELVEDTDSAGDSHAPSAETQVLSEMAEEQAEEILQEALSELEETERTLLHLRYHSKLKLEELAEIMQSSVSAVSRKIVRAEKKLRSICEKRGYRFQSE